MCRAREHVCVAGVHEAAAVQAAGAQGFHQPVGGRLAQLGDVSAVTLNPGQLRRGQRAVLLSRLTQFVDLVAIDQFR